MAYKEIRRHNHYTIDQTFQSRDDPPIHSASTRSYSWSDWRAGDGVPSYRKRIRLGLQATSSLEGEVTKIRSREGVAFYEYLTTPDPSVGYRSRERVGHLCANIGVADLPLSSEVSAAENVAREEFYKKYRNAQTAFQGGVALGELRETLRMLRNPAKALRLKVGELYKRILKNKRRAGRTNRSKNRYLSQTWLEGSYGWLPLINDIEDAYKLIDNRAAYLDRNLIPIKAEARVFDEYVDPDEVSSVSGGLNYSASSKVSTTCHVIYRGAVNCRASGTSCGERRLWGFTPDAIIPTVWELVPYSFLIDYFTNVGKVIDAWSLRGCTLAWGARTERRIGTRQSVDARSFNTKEDNYIVLKELFDIGDWYSEKKAITRTPIDTVPIPDFRFTLPDMATKWVNIAALVRVRNHRF